MAGIAKVSCLALLLMSPVAGASWVRVSSPHFEIFTDGGEAAARLVLARFEQAHRVVSAAGATSDGHFPTRILLFSSTRDYALLRPAVNVPGFYQSGPERDYIVMVASAELDRIILHEYTHSVLNHSFGRLPQWLEEGLAELYSTLTVENNRATVGAPVEPHVQTLSRATWLTPEALAAVTQESESYNVAGKTGIFYAQSWAMVHMLAFGDRYRGRLPALIDALSGGEPPADAFRRAFGKTFEEASRDLPAYVRTGFRTVEVDVPPAQDIVFSDTTALDIVAAAQARGEVLLLMGRDREAQRLYEDLARKYPESPAAQTGLAVIAMRDRDAEGARACFERAIRLGARDASTYFEYAMLLRDTGADAQLVTDFLEKAVAANPSHAEAQFLLGIRASDAERYSEAQAHLRQAVAILPRQAYFWQALSFAEFKLGHAAEARTAAVRALSCARTDHERDGARAAMRLVTETEGPEPPPRTGVTTPDSWKNPQGDRSISGKLIHVECGPSGTAKFRVQTDSGTAEFEIQNPSKVVLRGAPARTTLPCGPQSNSKVTIEYDGKSGTVTAIDFR